MVKELVSVVVTCYNHEKYIEQCIQSIYAQTYPAIELLVIDDGSTDDSAAIIQKNLEKNFFVRKEFLKQKNSGVCFSRNKGLEWANGDYLLFVDSDNYLDDNYIEELVQTAKEENADIVYSDLINAETKELFVEAQVFSLERYLESNFIDNCSLLRTAAIGEIRYDMALNRKKLVDYDFLMNMILNNQAKPVRCENAKLNYRVLENSISRQADHGTEKFYYEIYFYILGKHVDKFPRKMLEAAKGNLFTLEKRLEELIEHLKEITDYIHQQEDKVLTLSSEKKQAEIQLVEKKDEFFKEKQQLLDNQVQLVDQIHKLEIEKNGLAQEKQEILLSNSYKIGNMLIKPAAYGKRAIKNPRLVLKAAKKGGKVFIRFINKLPSPKKVYLKVYREVARSKNNYVNPKRVLIYVIYENQNHLQEYKRIFLAALAQLSEQVLIVVNGSLPKEDVESLKKYGQVELRENEGYDTAAFRYGIQFLGKEALSQFDELLLVNDTNVGPIGDLQKAFLKMADKKLDFWGISYGEEQPDFTQYNKYGYIPIHLQSYFLVIEKTLLHYPGFYAYWEALQDTNSRNKAVGKHETVFTKYFSDLGFRHGALTEKNEDSPMYIHPLTMLKEGVPLVKYTAFANYTNDKFAWQGLLRETEVPPLLEYIENHSDYPMSVINKIMTDVKNKKPKEHILIIDGVENAIPQLTKYRVENKAEQLRSLGYDVWIVNLSGFQMGYAEHASHIIIYRAPYNTQLSELIQLAKKYKKPVLYDIDDLVIDTKFTNQLSYVKGLSEVKKREYDQGVDSYGRMLRLCDGAIASTQKLQQELADYQSKVLLNRNLASNELIAISKNDQKAYTDDNKVIKIGYFSGSITHNENFELIKPAILKLLNEFQNIELHLVGHLDIPSDLAPYKTRIKTHPFVPWKDLPELVSKVDINLAPLVNSIFNEAKSEIKWLEAALVKVPTLASDLGAFNEMIEDEKTGGLVADDQWYEKLRYWIQKPDLRKEIAENAYQFVLENCVTEKHEDELTQFIRS